MKELLYLKDDQLKEFIEKISMSYRETFSDAKKVLDKYSIGVAHHKVCLLYTSPSPRDLSTSRMPSSA